MINLGQELLNYPPINLANLAESNREIPDNIKNSIILYNKALESLRTNSEDIAIIELKKAISISPDFYEAMNLLGICYSIINEDAKAIEVFQKVVEAEKNSVKALQYLNMLKSNNIPASYGTKIKKNDIAKKNGAKKVESAMPEDSINDRKSHADTSSGNVHSALNVKKNWKPGTIKFVIGFTAGALLISILNLSFGTGRNVNIPDSNPNDSSIQLNDELTSYKSKYSSLVKDYGELQKNLEAVNQNVDYYKFSLKLYEIEDMYLERDYETAADMLILMKTVDFKGAEKEKFNAMYEEIMPVAAKTVYDEGSVLVNSKQQYQEALKKLNKVQTYVDDFDRMDSVLYYTGKCYQQLNDSRSALAAFQRLSSEYPESSYIKWAKIRVKEITELP